MKWSVAGLIVLGLLAAVSAAILVATLRGGEAPKGPTEKEAQVVVATKPIAAMTQVTSDSVAVRAMPANAAPKKHFSYAAQVVGKIAAQNIVVDQLFEPGCFITEGSKALLASSLQPGERAVSLALSNYASVESMLYPGCKVDIVFCPDAPGEGKVPESITLLTDVTVLVVGDQTVLSEEESPADASRIPRRQGTVTVKVNQEQAQILHLAAENGSLSLSVRGPLDPNPVAVAPTPLSALTAYSRKQQSVQPLPPATAGSQPASVAPAWEVTVILGDSEQTCSFDRSQAQEK